MTTNMRRWLPTLAVIVALGAGVAIGIALTRGPWGSHSAAPEPPPQALAIPSAIQLSSSFARIAAEIEPAVVNINTETMVRVSGRHHGSGDDDQVPFDDFFNRFFHFGGPGQPKDAFQRRSLGSGVILDRRGYVLTNYHVVTQDGENKPVDRIEVYLNGDDGTRYRARIVGEDRWTDLAVIKIDAGKPLAAAQLGDSGKTRVGDWVIAIGSPFGLDSSVTAGIISAKGRDIEPGMEGQFKRFIQTDAAINPGNSGGPLVNLAGQVIGINTAIATSQGANDGIGFAIPSNTVRQIYNSLISTGQVERGAIGVTFLDQVNPALLRSFGADHGVVINGVEAGSPAERAGLKMGDVIVSIGGKSVHSGDQLVQIVSGSKVGTHLAVMALRDGKEFKTSVEVGNRNKIVSENRQVISGDRSGTPETQGPLGVTVQDLSSGEAAELTRVLHLKRREGVLVTEVEPESFASDLNLERGDVILGVNHQKVSSTGDFARIESGLKSGDDVLLLIARRTGKSFATLFLADRLP